MDNKRTLTLPPVARVSSRARSSARRQSAGICKDDCLTAVLIRMRALASGRPLSRDVSPDQSGAEELISFWADPKPSIRPAYGVPPGQCGRQMMIRIPGDSAASPASGQVCAMLAFDIPEFTRPDRDQDVRIYLHETLYKILAAAFQGSGIPWDQCHHEDRGDGALVIMPPYIPAYPIIDPFPERLRGLIRRHNRMACETARMQLRAAAHIGPVYSDEHGLIGDDINLLFRMLDAAPLRKALDGSAAELALAVSSYMHESHVLRHPTLVDPALFQPLKTRVKRTQVNAWVHLPGRPAQLTKQETA
jgi:hypothetical protein